MTRRHLAVHGHFYQPPRENPWLGCVEAEHNTGGMHDWNSIITAECYGPLAAVPVARRGKTADELLNLYTQISFNFGPTLLNWLEYRHRSLYLAILQADRESAKKRSGHGNALAQVYNHVIMPLASQRDKRTQIIWGLEDFRYRFGREPEGMWLAETAVDEATLEELCLHGLRFALLAPRSLASKRMSGVRTNEPVHPDDYTRPYRWHCRQQKGKFIDLFFYSPQLADAMRAGGCSNPGVLPEQTRLLLPAGVREPRLLSYASDGEDYGHHFKTGHLALAGALCAVEAKGLARITNYGEFLDICGAPRFEAEIVSPSAWSCPHGVGRWTDDCGCTSPDQPKGWNQKWRRPLRETFNRLAEKLDGFYETESAAVFTDSRAAREGYIACLNADRMRRLRGYVKSCLRPSAAPQDLKKGLKLLEMQRNRLLMFTSCGWFFDELSGLEPVQTMKYAAMACGLAAELGCNAEQELEAGLARCPSNLPRFKSGDRVYRALVKPAAITPARAAAHYSLALTCRLELPFEDGTAFHYKLTDEGIAAAHIRAYLVRTETSDTMEQRPFSIFVLKKSADKYCAAGADCFAAPAHNPAAHAKFFDRLQSEPDRAQEILAGAGYEHFTETALLADWRRANPMFANPAPAEKDRLLQHWTETLARARYADLLTPALMAELDAMRAAGLRPAAIPWLDQLSALCADRFSLALESFSAARLAAVLPWLEYFSNAGLSNWRALLALRNFLPGLSATRTDPEFTRLLRQAAPLMGVKTIS
ncbi:MAG: DUF3536 domain-containing protein [Elusimicrobiaceae bacterium]|nr:DUF3536 domain-containing protein [Elusimicrobiaceae bacterium]